MKSSSKVTSKNSPFLIYQKIFREPAKIRGFLSYYKKAYQFSNFHWNPTSTVGGSFWTFSRSLQFLKHFLEYKSGKTCQESISAYFLICQIKMGERFIFPTLRASRSKALTYDLFEFLLKNPLILGVTHFFHREIFTACERSFNFRSEWSGASSGFWALIG